MIDLGTLGLKIQVDSSSLDTLDNRVSSSASNLKGTLASAGKTAGKAILAGMATATAATVALGKSALDAYADYEQLSGGVETLFGDDATTVLNNANNAFKTAGLSANDYMETVTSFSASLISSLGGDTEKAATAADQAITDMSDNANKMGTDISSIQNAYQGFAKQNYTMLDNLNLGYGGTKTEMERLLSDAEKLTGKKYDISNFNDITEAIHAIQTEMGITGTTAEEAMGTIEGSVNMLKASWQNLLTGMADDNADFDSLMDNLMTSLEATITNIMPRITTIMQNVGTFIVEASQTIVPDLVSNLVSFIPQLVESGTALLTGLLDGIKQAIPQLVEALPEVINGIIDFFTNNIDTVIDIGMELLLGLVDGLIGAIPKLVEAIPKIITSLVNAIVKYLPQIIATGGKLIVALVQGITKLIPKLIAMAPQLIGKFVTGILNARAQLRQAGKNVLQALKDGISNGWQTIVSWFSEKIKSLFSWDTVKSWFGKKSGNRIGLREVPYDGYVSLLHKGETVLTAAETNKLGQELTDTTTTSGGNIEINFNGNYSFGDKSDIDYFMTQSQKLINRRLAL